jgi:hypothetical protein
MSRVLVAAVVYFLLVMVAGFVFAAVRELLLVPSFGRAVGEPLETPLMLAAIATSAWLSVQWFHVPPKFSSRLMMGGSSLALVLAAEFALSPFVRGSVQAWFDSFTPLTFALTLALWLAHAAMPALIRVTGRIG